MKKVPDMISTKDLAYISDIFNWNITAAKKLALYMDSCDDEEICKEFNNLEAMHIDNCKNLCNILEKCGSNE